MEDIILKFFGCLAFVQFGGYIFFMFLHACKFPQKNGQVTDGMAHDDTV
jgi:hypothetical protein